MQNELTILHDFLINNDLLAEAIPILSVDDFQHVATKTYYSAMAEMYKKNLGIDVVSVANYIGLEKYAVQCGAGFGSKGSSASPSPKAWRTHLKAVKDNGDRVRLYNLMKDASDRLKDGDEPKKVLSAIKNFVIEGVNEKQGTLTTKEILELTVMDLQEGLDYGGKIRGISTGYRQIDEATGGFNKGDLMIISARPSMGKTALVLNMMNRTPKEKNILLFEMEMSAEKLGARLLASETGINPQNISMGRVSETQVDVVLKTVNRVANKGNMLFDCTAGYTVGEIASVIKQVKIKHGVDVVIIDHIGKIRPDNLRASRNDQVGQITNELKNMAKDLDVCIVALSQLSRGVEQRENKRPMMSDLRDSGNIEQDADQVLMLYRDAYYNEFTELPDELEVIVAKNRDGRVGTLVLDYNLGTQRIKEKGEI